MKVEICKHLLQYYVKVDNIRVSEFFNTEDAAIEWALGRYDF